MWTLRPQPLPGRTTEMPTHTYIHIHTHIHTPVQCNVSIPQTNMFRNSWTMTWNYLLVCVTGIVHSVEQTEQGGQTREVGWEGGGELQLLQTAVSPAWPTLDVSGIGRGLFHPPKGKSLFPLVVPLSWKSKFQKKNSTNITPIVFFWVFFFPFHFTHINIWHFSDYSSHPDRSEGWLMTHCCTVNVPW